jgi:outer membrane protein TolC
MKKVILLLMISARLCAQNVDYNKVILPEGVRTADFAEKLVQIAWRNNPANDVLRRQVTIAGYNVKQSGAGWLDIITVSGNANQFTLNPQSDQFNRANFYPKYNVHASINLGMFLTIPYTTKVRREELMIAQSNVNSQKLALRSAVIKAYNTYLMQEKIYKVQSQLLLDNETSHKLVEQRFRSGETNFETYSMSLNNYSQLNIASIQAENNYRSAKLDLEQLIGVRLEDVR